MIAALAGCTGGGGSGGDGSSGGGGEGSDGGSSDGSDGGSSGYQYPETSLTYVVSAEGTATYTMFVTLSSLLSEKDHPIQMDTQASGGQVGTTRLISQGRFEIGMGGGPPTIQAINGEGPYEKKHVLYQANPILVAPMFIYVRDDSDITSLQDLDGMAISTGPTGSQPGLLTQGVLDHMDDPIDLEINHMGYEEAALAMLDGKYPGMAGYMFKGASGDGILAPWGQQMVQQGDVRALPWPEGAAQRYIDDSGYIATTVGENEDLPFTVREPFLCVTNYVITLMNENLSNDVAYAYMKLLDDYEDELKERAPVWGAWTDTFSKDPLAFTAADIPVHPGVAEYLKERDLWKDDFTTSF